MSMLMIFIIMTYARLETYRTMAGIESLFTTYMEATERTYINMSADNQYNKIHFSKTSTEPKQPNESKPPKGKSSGRLSLLPLTDSKLKESNPKDYEETVLILKRLILSLYADQKNIGNMLEKKPELISEIIDQIPKAVEKLPKSNKKLKPIDLSNLELGAGLDEVFYLMLKGCPSSSHTPTAIVKDGDEDDEDDDYVSDKSYDSLLNFIDFHSSLKINVYIASKPLLLAIYGNPATVEKLLIARKELYQLVKDKKMEADDASERLKSDFQLGNDDNFLEYKVTGSNPQNYT